jgi:uncharacterized damage-inducible protein DinB
MGIREAVLPGFGLIWSTVQKNVEAMPDDGLSFRPDGLETRSFRDIALHMSNVSVTFGENVGRSSWERILAYSPENYADKTRLLSALKEAGERFMSGLTRLSDEEAARVVRTPWGMEMPQGQVVGAHVPHMFYHNGQLSIYLRMRGVKPLFLAR